MKIVLGILGGVTLFFAVALGLAWAILAMSDSEGPGHLPSHCVQGHQEVHDGVRYAICDRYQTVLP